MSEKQRGRLEELLQQEVPAHGGAPFIAEPDLRALPAFKKGEASELKKTGPATRTVAAGTVQTSILSPNVFIEFCMTL